MKLITGLTLILLFCFIWLGLILDANWLLILDQLGDQLLRSNITEANTKFFSIMTKFGDYAIIALLAVITSITLFIFKQKFIAIWFTLTMAICGAVVPYLLKNWIQRTRPTHGLIERSGYSFPSGHTTGAVVFYGLLIVIAILLFDRKYQKIMTSISIFLIIIIMCSRVYLGVHFPSDVLASAALGSGQLFCSVWFYQNIWLSKENITKKIRK